jgi:hypothetical protein
MIWFYVCCEPKTCFNVKVKLTLCFNWAPRHEGILGSRGIAPLIHLGTRWKWVVSFTPRPLYRREGAPGTHCTLWLGGCVGPRAVLDAVVKRKIPSPRRESNPTTPIVQPVAQRYTDWAITYWIILKYILSKCTEARLRARWPEFSSRRERWWDFFSPSHRVETGSGAHPASYPMHTRDEAAGAWSRPPTSI